MNRRPYLKPLLTRLGLLRTLTRFSSAKGSTLQDWLNQNNGPSAPKH
jgi:hypothetical protein